MPEEYRTNSHIASKLPQVKMALFAEDVLFYTFYNLTAEVYQLAAAAELYCREWRFHKTEQRWLTRAQANSAVREQTTTYEKGMYYVFEPAQWRKV